MAVLSAQESMPSETTITMMTMSSEKKGENAPMIFLIRILRKIVDKNVSLIVSSEKKVWNHDS
jgi:hypothetical protein